MKIIPFEVIMKPWPLYILLAFMMTIASAPGAAAQDAGMSELEVIDEPAHDKAAFVPGEEVRYIPQSAGRTQARDSLMLHMHDFPMQQATMKPAERSSDKQAAGKPKDDSILTFNFLYYIIQKYKLQDIID